MKIIIRSANARMKHRVRRPFVARCLSVLTALASMSIGLTVRTSPASAATTGLAAVWGGTLNGTDAYLSIASNGKEILAYVCDGQTLAQWFKAKRGDRGVNLTKGTLDVTAKDAHLVAKLGIRGGSGTVTLADGTRHAFSIARRSGDAGLYRSEETIDGVKTVGGWIVLADGRLRGGLLPSVGTFQGLTALRTTARLMGPDLPY